jgi:2-polyprenyl-3-methyl-5-hydroxy-6-metoxy-1,4-benzoquinol methylase
LTHPEGNLGRKECEWLNRGAMGQGPALSAARASNWQMPICPVCSGTEFSTLVPSSKIDEECRARERFVKERLARPASQDELKDLTDFFHQSAANILTCTKCKLLVRDECEPPPAETYSEDEYDPDVMQHLYPRYLEAFRRKEKPYRALVPRGGRVLEIGSHYGAFLQTAQEWEWRAEGVDIGKDTRRFARSKGFTVHSKEVGECEFGNHSFDAIFIWNCFEQLEDPKPTLAECRRLIKPGGLLTLRTPNGLFYTLCETLLAQPGLQSQAAEFLSEAMGYNNLLGFPYLYGYSAANLEELVKRFGFRPEGMLNSELITLPLPQNPDWVEKEEHAINSEVRMLAESVLADRDGTLTGPWIEVWFRSA